MQNTISRTPSTLSETHIGRLSSEASGVIDSMVGYVHNSPILLSQFLLWKNLHDKAGTPVTGDNPVYAFILENVKNGTYPILSFVPLEKQNTFTGSVTGTIESNSR